MLVYAGKLDIGLRGISDDEAVNNALRDRLGDGMAQQTLYLNASGIGSIVGELRQIIVKDVRECRLAQCIGRCRRGAGHVRGPSVDLSLQPRCSVLVDGSSSI